MESLGDILKRASPPRNTSENGTVTSAGNDTAEEAEKTQCHFCRGRGWLRVDVPFGQPDFGKLVPCRCVQAEFERERPSRLERYGNLEPFKRFTFEKLIPQGKSSDLRDKETFERCYLTAEGYAQNPWGWLVLVGPSGCGKTHMAAAIANRRHEQGYLVYISTVSDLLDQLKSTFHPESDVGYHELFERVRNVPLLVLDDLDYHSSTPWAEEKLFQVLNHRFNSELPSVVTCAGLDRIDGRLATRLRDAGIARICELKKVQPPLFQQLGGITQEFLVERTFETFDPRGMNADQEGEESLGKALEAARDFAEAPKYWLCLMGLTGCGKTHLAAAIAGHRLKSGHPVFFAVVPDLLDYVRSTFSPESRIAYDDVFERVKTTELLILDDLGSESATPWVQEKLYQILNYRYNTRLATVITTGVINPENIEKRLASRIADPKMTTEIHIAAPDYRCQPRTEEKPRTPPKRPYRRR